MKRTITPFSLSVLLLCLMAVVVMLCSGCPDDDRGPAPISSLTVIDFTPSSVGGPVGTNVPIMVTFSVDIDPLTLIDGSTFTVSDSLGDIAGGSISYDGGTFVATYTGPGGNVTPGDTIVVSLTNGILAMNGDALFSPLPYSYDTLAGPDLTPPNVTMFTPDNGSAPVSVATHQVIQFSEPMDQASVEAAFSISDTSGLLAGVHQYVWNGAGDQVTIAIGTDGDAVIGPDELLKDGGELYTIQVATSATDIVGNPLVASGNSDSWMTVLDATAPGILAIGSAGQSDLLSGTFPVADYQIGQGFTIQFDEPMDQTALDAEILLSNEAETRSGQAGGSSVFGLTVSWNSPQVLQVLAANAPLLSGVEYKLEVSATDISGNRFIQNGPMVLVTEGVNANVPSVVATIPGDGSTGVSPNAMILIQFSQVMAPNIGSHILVQNAGGTPYDLIREGDLAYVGLAPQAGWPVGQTITVTVDSFAENAALPSAKLGADHTFSFTIGSNDSEAFGVAQAFSSLKDGDIDIPMAPDNFDFNLRLVNVSGDFVFPNIWGFNSQTILLREATSMLPVKGINVGFNSEDGSLNLQAGPAFPGLQAGLSYELVFQPGFENSYGDGITPEVLGFTVTNGNAKPVVTEVSADNVLSTALGGFGLRMDVLLVQAEDADLDVLTADVRSVEAGDFFGPEMMFNAGSFGFFYQSSGNEYSSFLESNKYHTMRYTLDDGVAGHATSIDQEIFIFNQSDLPTGISATNSATPIYQMSIGPVIQANAQMAAFIVEDSSSGAEMFIGLAPIPTVGSVITLNHPADVPLPSGNYDILGFVAVFDTGTVRGDFAGLGVNAGPSITVP